MIMPGRNFNADQYRFGFNGMESDDELKGVGNSLNFKYRMYDPRIARFFAVDPLTKDYPYWTPYQFAGLMPIRYVELEGLEPGDRLICSNAVREGQKQIGLSEKQINENGQNAAKIGIVSSLVAVDLIFTKGRYTQKFGKEAFKQFGANFLINTSLELYKNPNNPINAVKEAFNDALTSVDGADAAFSAFMQNKTIATLLSSSLDITIDENGEINGQSILDNKDAVDFGLDLIVNTLLDEVKGYGVPQNMRTKEAVDNFIDATGVDVRQFVEDIFRDEDEPTESEDTDENSQ